MFWNKLSLNVCGEFIPIPSRAASDCLSSSEKHLLRYLAEYDFRYNIG